MQKAGDVSMQSKTRLGKGLSALIPQPEKGSPADASYYLNVEDIHDNPDQPRKHFDEKELRGLAETIRDIGVLQPLLVRHIGTHIELLAGERRLRAAKIAGLKQVPVVFREVGAAEGLELSMIENIQRESLNPIEEASGMQSLLDRNETTQRVLATRLGKDRSTVANTVRLLKLPEEIRKDIVSGEISAGHGRALLALEDPEAQKSVWKAVKQRGLSVRKTERAVQAYGEKKPRPAEVQMTREMSALQDQISSKLECAVRIRPMRKGGKVEIPFSSGEDLERILSLLGS